MTIFPAIIQAAASTRKPQDILDARKSTRAEHTPGPWTIRTKRGKPLWVEGKIWIDGPTGLNSNVVGEKFGPPICEAHFEANARLPAAAPDLLEALKLARECIAYCRRAHPDAQSGEGIPVEVFIDAAIAKAVSP